MAQAQMKLSSTTRSGRRPARPDHRRVRQEWNKTHPQVQVEPVFAGNYTEAYAKTLAAIQAGTPPDVAIMLSQNLNDIISQNIVIPLDELIAADTAQMKMDDFYPAFMLNSTSGGKVWSIPFQRSTPVMYYNKEAFKEVGLDPNKPPQTWTEMVAARKKLTKQEAAGPPLGPRDPVQRRRRHVALRGAHHRGGRPPLRREQLLLQGPAREQAGGDRGPVPPELGEKEKVSPPERSTGARRRTTSPPATWR
jgi:hypothetical protein